MEEDEGKEEGEEGQEGEESSAASEEHEVISSSEDEGLYQCLKLTSNTYIISLC